MNWKTAKNKIADKFNTELQAVYSIPIAYQNRNFDKENEKEFLNLSIIPAVSEQETQDANAIIMRSGQVNIQVFTEKNTGTNNAYTILENILNIFNNLEYEKMYFEPESVTEVVNTERKWFQINITIPFFYQAVKE